MRTRPPFRADHVGSLLRSAALMLDHIGQREVAAKIEQSVRRTLQAGRGLTRDLGGGGNTRTLTEQLVKNLWWIEK